jgi:hypothetical protein
MTCGLILLLGSARILMPQVVACSSTRGQALRRAARAYVDPQLK